MGHTVALRVGSGLSSCERAALAAVSRTAYCSGEVHLLHPPLLRHPGQIARVSHHAHL